MRLGKKILGSDFIRNTLLLSGGAVFSQVITIFTAPWLSRIYSPADYGILTLYMTITGLVGVLTSLQLHNVIIISKDEEEAGKVLKLIILVSGLFAIFTLVFILLVFFRVINLGNISDLGLWIFLSPVSIFFMGWNTAFSAWANRSKDYKLLTRNRLFSAILVPLVSITLGYLLKGPSGLLIGFIVSQVLPSILLSRFYVKQGVRFPAFGEVQARSLFRKHSHYLKFTLPSDFINNLVNQVPVFMFARYYGQTALGSYGMSNRMLGLPVLLVSNSTAEVFRQRASHDYTSNRNCFPLYVKTARTLFLLGILPFTLLFFFGPQLFHYILGGQWVIAGQISSVLAPMFLLRFVVSPLSYMYFIAGRQKEDFLFHVIFIVVLIVSLLAAYYLNGTMIDFMITFSVVYSASYIVSFFRCLKFSKGIQQ